MHPTEQFLELLSKYTSGTLTVEEEAQLISLLQTGKYRDWLDMDISEKLQQDENIIPLSADRSAAIIQAILQKNNSAPVHRVHFMRSWRWVAAASIVLVLGVASFWWMNNVKHDTSVVNTSNTPVDIAPGGNKAILTLSDGTKITLDSAANGAIAQQGNADIIKLADGQLAYELKGLSQEQVLLNTMSTPRGGQYRLTLPDGSKIWLNAASSVIYPTAFTGRERKVTITGEAYFEVAKNANKPFIVDIDGKGTVEVLGTHFNINSYADEEGIRTTLLEGSVRMKPGSAANRGMSNEVILKPGEQAILAQSAQSGTGTAISIHRSVDLDQVMAWKNGLFNFNGADLPAVMRQLEKWYDIQVKFEGVVPNKEFKGKMNRSINLSGVLEMLTEFNIQYELSARTLLIKSI